MGDLNIYLSWADIVPRVTSRLSTELHFYLIPGYRMRLSAQKHTLPHGLDEDNIHFSWNYIRTKLYDERLHNTTVYGQYKITCACNNITTYNSNDSLKNSAIDHMTKTKTLDPYIETIFRELLLKITLQIQDLNGLSIETWAK